jgi:hypothetical protein
VHADVRDPAAAIARLDRAHAIADLVDGPDGFVRTVRPLVTSGTSPLRMCRSVPQMVTASTRTMTSPSSVISGSGTSSQAFWPGPW